MTDPLSLAIQALVARVDELAAVDLGSLSPEDQVAAIRELFALEADARRLHASLVADLVSQTIAASLAGMRG